MEQQKGSDGAIAPFLIKQDRGINVYQEATPVVSSGYFDGLSTNLTVNQYWTREKASLIRKLIK